MNEYNKKLGGENIFESPLKFKHYLDYTENGFTLVELLVAIIIIGLLAATALPSFLNQASKARGSEAKSMLGSINRSQQSYRALRGQFAANIADLDISPKGKFYSYEIGLINSQSAWANTPSAISNNLKLYSSAIVQVGDFMGQVICESIAPNTPAGNATAPTMPGDQGSCPSSSSILVD